MSKEEKKKNDKMEEPAETYATKETSFKRDRTLVHKAYEDSQRADAITYTSEEIRKKLRKTISKWM